MRIAPPPRRNDAAGGEKCGALRYASTLVLVLFGATRISTAVHYAFVQHAICADHGEAIHGPQASQVSEQGAGGDPDDTTAEPSALASDADDSHDHELCLALRIRRDEVGVVLNMDSVVGHVAALTAAQPSALEAHRGARAILLWAPKSSPPV